MNLSRTPTKKNLGSGLWREINKSLPHLLKHGKWSISDGMSVDVWEDNWIEDGACISNHVQSITYNL